VTNTDTLASIAAQFDTTTSKLKKSNRLMSDMVIPGKVIRFLADHRRKVVQQHTEGMVASIRSFFGNLLLFPAVKKNLKIR